MKCPVCINQSLRCMDSRQRGVGRYRRYVCPKCRTRQTTTEVFVTAKPGMRVGQSLINKLADSKEGMEVAQLIIQRLLDREKKTMCPATVADELLRAA